MNPFDILNEILFDYTLRTVTLGAAALGAVSGCLGVYAVLRRQSLLGDAISHAALPGIVLAFMITGSKATLILVLGAAMAGWLGTLLVMVVVRATRIPEDSALGIILSVFFGAGLVLLTFVQRRPDAAQAGLETFLFGQAATLVGRDVSVIVGLGAIAILVVLLFWKEFKVLSFDPEFGSSLGLPMHRIDVLLTTVLVLAIVIGLQTVGVVLMSAMVVAPAAAARQWTDSLSVMVLLSSLFGALAGASGAVISSLTVGLPTGPTIVLSITLLVVISLAFAPRRGLVWNKVRRYRNRSRLRLDAVLLDLYSLESHHEGFGPGHPVPVLEAMSRGKGGVRKSLERLAERTLAVKSDEDYWKLTEQGSLRAAELTRDGESDS